MTLAEVAVDDDAQGASFGDGDGLVDFGETIELTVTLENIGHLDAYDVIGELTCLSPFVEMRVGEADFGMIPAGGSATNAAPLVFDVAPAIPDGEELDFELLLSEDPGAHGFDLLAHAPAYFISVLDLDDSAGDGDGVADPGETVELELAIENVGSSDSPDLIATLDSPTPYYVPEPTPNPIGVIAVGDRVIAGGFRTAITPECPSHHADYLLLNLVDAGAYDLAPAFVFCTGQAFADEFETPAASWRHAAGPGLWIDQWHRETLRNHTPGGQTSWKCGGPGDWSYGNLLYAILETAEFPLPSNGRLEFWHWIDAEISAAYPGYCYDGGLLEISTDGGASWLPLTPDGGYPYLIRAGSIPGPFPAETPVWSGEHDWSAVGVDLSGHEGSAKLRWVFGTDGADVREGWYLDDIRVGTGWPSDTGPAESWTAVHPRLLPARPNPVVFSTSGAGTAHLRFVLPQAASGELALYDPAGRRIRVLMRGTLAPGWNEVAWDGLDQEGRPLAAGSYFLRLALEGTERIQKVTIIR